MIMKVENEREVIINMKNVFLITENCTEKKNAATKEREERERGGEVENEK